MNDIFLNSAYAGVVLTFLGYWIGLRLKRRFKKTLFNPLIIATVFVILVLLLCHIDYESYNHSAKYLSYLLTPATVALAIPLYMQMDTLKKNLKAILISLTAGAFAGMASICAMSALFGITHAQYVTLLPKSITMAIGTALAEEYGGYPAITVAAIVLTGLTGNVFAESFAKLFRIKDPVAKGLAIGASSHAVGTAKAMEIGEVEGAMSSLAIVISGLLTVIGASIFAMLW